MLERPTNPATNALAGDAIELVRRADLLQPAAAHDGHAVAELERLVLLVGHEHGGDPDPVDEIPNLAARALAQGGVEVGERLVQQEHARLRCQRAGERHPLLLPARELVDAAGAESRQIHQRQGAIHAALQVRTPDPDRLEAEGHVAPHVEVREQSVVLEHHAEPARDRRHRGDVLLLHEHPPRVRRLEPREQPERRGLAAAARPEEREQLTPLEAERDPVDCHGAIEPLDQALDSEEGAHGHAVRPVPRTWRSQ